MNIPFYKMHGIGNDFVIIDNCAKNISFTERRISALCDRRYGIGCDQLVVLSAARDESADIYVQFFNPDGSESGACGNASRCVAALLHEKLDKKNILLQTNAALLSTEIIDNKTVSVDMGVPGLKWQEVPLSQDVDTLHLPISGDPIAASMGNPHVTFFVDDLSTVDPVFCGQVLENDPLFPEKANIGFVQMLDRQSMRLRVWERGAGLTLACGSGACASVVNAVRRGLADRECLVKMDGGSLTIYWREKDDHVIMTGPAVLSFSGNFNQDTYPL